MKTNFLAFTMGLLATGALLAIPFAAAQESGVQAGADQNLAPQGGHRHHRGFGEEGRGGREGFQKWQAIESSLSAEQKQQISAIRQQTKADSKPLRDQMQALKSQLEANPQAANADDLKSQLRALHQQMRAQFKSGHEKMMAVLTPAQRTQLEQPAANGPQSNQ